MRARKGLGQHFLVDGSYLKHILTAAELTANDNVIEVGPGLGVLTRALSGQAGHVLAVEKDEHLAELLKETYKERANVEIVNYDILKQNVADLIKAFPGREPQYKLVANLPYYITSPVLRLFLEAQVKPERLVVMVQKEVAKQITAAPGDMSLLTVGIQLYGEPKIIKYVPARPYPPPDVDSAILKIAVFARPRVDVEIQSFFTLVRAGFSAAAGSRLQILFRTASTFPRTTFFLCLGVPELIRNVEPRRCLLKSGDSSGENTILWKWRRDCS